MSVQHQLNGYWTPHRVRDLLQEPNIIPRRPGHYAIFRRQNDVWRVQYIGKGAAETSGIYGRLYARHIKEFRRMFRGDFSVCESFVVAWYECPTVMVKPREEFLIAAIKPPGNDQYAKWAHRVPSNWHEAHTVDLLYWTDQERRVALELLGVVSDLNQDLYEL